MPSHMRHALATYEREQTGDQKEGRRDGTLIIVYVALTFAGTGESTYHQLVVRILVVRGTLGFVRHLVRGVAIPDPRPQLLVIQCVRLENLLRRPTGALQHLLLQGPNKLGEVGSCVHGLGFVVDSAHHLQDVQGSVGVVDGANCRDNTGVQLILRLAVAIFCNRLRVQLPQLVEDVSVMLSSNGDVGSICETGNEGTLSPVPVKQKGAKCNLGVRM